MPMKPQYTGPNYQLLWAQSFSDAMGSNGAVDVDGKAMPRLSNAQVVALAAAWKRAAARSKEPRWQPWYDITIAALGWRNPGDKFVMTKEHAGAGAPVELVEYFWAATKQLAAELDQNQTKLRPLIVNYAFAGYEAAARDAWHIMKTEAKASAAPAASASPAIETTSDSPAKPAESSGWGGAVILIVLLLAAGALKRKQRR